MTVGENIKHLRHIRGITQKKLGELSGVHEVQIRAYELGRQKPKYETLEKIAAALGVRVESLIHARPSVVSSTRKISSYVDLINNGDKAHINSVHVKELDDENMPYEFVGIDVFSNGDVVFLNEDELNSLIESTIEMSNTLLNLYLNNKKFYSENSSSKHSKELFEGKGIMYSGPAGKGHLTKNNLQKNNS